jgi:hypothetical protein
MTRSIFNFVMVVVLLKEIVMMRVLSLMFLFEMVYPIELPVVDPVNSVKK